MGRQRAHAPTPPRSPYPQELSTDGAGTLIATCDVRGGIEFEVQP